MKTVYSLALCATLIAPAFAASGNPANPGRFYSYQHENVLGTSFEIKLAAATEAAARQGEAAALAEIDREARILSAYDPASEFSRWTRTRNQRQSLARTARSARTVRPVAHSHQRSARRLR